MKKYFWKNKYNLFLYVLLSVFAYICVTGVYQMYSLVTEVTESLDYHRAYQTLIYGVLVVAALFVLLIALAVVKRTALSNIMIDLRNDIFDQIKKMNIHSFGSTETSFYTSMMVNDVEMLEESYFDKVFELIGDSIQLIVMLIFITRIGWQYTLVVVMFAILSGIQPTLLKKRLAYRGVCVSEELEEYTACVKEHINAFDTIKSFQSKDIFSKIFTKRVHTLEDANSKLWKTKMWNTILVLFSVYLLKVGTQLFFAYSALSGVVSIAAVALLFGLANNVGNPIVSILSYLEPINMTKDVRKKIEDFCNDKTTWELDGKEKISGTDTTIEIRNLSFGYEEGKKVLRNLDLTFEEGKKYALVGESGSGKSTILKLLMGYYNDYSGKVFIGDKELSTIDKKSLRDKMTFITQNTYLFRGPLRNNLIFSNENVSEETLSNVLKKVQIDSLVENLTNGIDENVEVGSNNFSGGEKQRLCIARGMLKDSNTILMDEGTSALDNVTAVAVEKELLKQKDKTLIAVIHRFNETIKMYDCIYFLEKGKIVEMGNYEQLMNYNGRFRNMMLAQGGIN